MSGAAPITCDVAAWRLNGAHRWVYDRLLVASTQDYQSGPTEIRPSVRPVIVKPIMSLFGMGRETVLTHEVPMAPGMMWAERLEGRLVSTDAMVNNGRITWAAQAIGVRDAATLRFVAWYLETDSVDPELGIVEGWVSEYLPDYVGPLNVETIGGQIIEVHLRLTADWQDAGLYAEPRRRAVGVPIWSEDVHCEGLPDWVLQGEKDERPQRHGWLVTAL